MRIWPAIDLRGGKCVRLQQGDYNRETVFNDDPVQVAKRWVEEGADCLHLVDLDGARDGNLVNGEVIEISSSTVGSGPLPDQISGIAVNLQDSVAYLPDHFAKRLYQLDLATGDRA